MHQILDGFYIGDRFDALEWPADDPSIALSTTDTLCDQYHIPARPATIDADTLARAAEHIASTRCTSDSVLAYCHDGRSIAPAAAMAYLMIEHGYDIDHAYVAVENETAFNRSTIAALQAIDERMPSEAPVRFEQ